MQKTTKRLRPEKRIKIRRTGRRSVAPGRQNGFHTGYKAGYDAGYNIGFDAGLTNFHQPFSGTSIIIPTFNQVELLRDCIESIIAHTPEPHEIIVVDNASTDGTAEYLYSLRHQIRFRINPANMGFAGGVNQGLKMARGETLLILNNDTVVTQGWLANMLRCLNSDGRIGLVGPMTNYISGKQLLNVSYGSIAEMHRFAEMFNRPDPARWRRTDRITGFCVLLRRELFARLGYFDEGFEKGNCEDDDFCLRVKLLGHDLVIAGDVFIHHVGSVSMKALGAEMNEVYGKNLEFYGQKWGNLPEITEEARLLSSEGKSMLDFYPREAIVCGNQGMRYWLDGGGRRPILEQDGQLSPAVRLSHVELRSWPLGEAVSEAAVRERISQTAGQTGIREGALLQGESGRIYRYEQGSLRRIVSELALTVWGFDRSETIAAGDAELASLPKGLPIIAPISIMAENL
nr:glycosyltransferase family 2 protein [Paenibacillus hamazuiensis]